MRPRGLYRATAGSTDTRAHREASAHRIENVPEAIVAKDARSLRYVFANRGAERLYGISRREIVGKTARDLFPASNAELIERL